MKTMKIGPLLTGLILAGVAITASGVHAATVSLGTSTPAVGDGVQNLNYSADAASNTQEQYVPDNQIGNRTDGLTIGQSFTTGTNAGGYALSSVSVRQVSWGPTSWDYTGGNVTIRFFDLTGGASPVWNTTEMLTESAAVGGAAGGSTTDGTPSSPQWLTFTFSSPVSLKPNTLYGFAIGSDGNSANDGFFMEWDGTSTSSYANGFAFSVDTSTSLWDGGDGLLSDRAFVAAMTAKATPPFYPVTGSPAAGSSNALNNVTLSAQIVDWGATFTSGKLYLDSLGNEVPSTPSNLGAGTNLLQATSSTNLAPDSTHTVYVVANTSSGQSVTNSWTFTMAGQFGISVSPEGIATDAYDFKPTISAQVVELNDTLDYVELFSSANSNSVFQAPQGTTTTVSIASTTLVPGQVVTNMVIAHSYLGAYPDVTNTWSFTMGGVVGITAWNANNPIPGTYDITQFVASADNGGNCGGGGGPNTFIANNQPVQGQFFTTGPSNQWTLSSFWLKDITYPEYGYFKAGNHYTVRITDPSKAGTAGFVVATEVLTALNDDLTHMGTAGSGKWLQFRLANPVTLNPNKMYGFDVGDPDNTGYFSVSGTSADVYAGGYAYGSGSGGNGSTSIDYTPTGDRTFMVSLTPVAAALIVDSVSPEGSGVTNNATLQAVVSEGSSTFVSAQLFLDGNEVSPVNASGTGPYTISYDLWSLPPLSTHTGMVVAAASGSAYVTNEWTFTMEDSFSLTAQTPAAGAFISTNDTPISVQVVNGADSLTSATMYLDGTQIATSPSNQLSVASSGALDPGSHTVTVISTGLQYGPATNSWSFEVAGGPGGITIWGTKNPSVTADDIYQFVAGTSDSENVSGGDPTYIATDHPAQGQLFTTGSAAGYELSGFWLKLVGYNGTWSGLSAGQSCVVRIVDTSAANAVVYTEPLTVKNDYPDVVSGGATGSGRWMQFELTTPVTLDPGKTYGFDVGTTVGACYYQLSGINSNYYGGNAYSSGAGGVANSTLTENVGNRTFMVELTAVALPDVAILSTSPSGTVLNSTPEVKVVMKDLGVTVDPGNVRLLLDGNDVTGELVSKVGTTTTVTYASTTLPDGPHTAGVIASAGGKTNAWSFSVLAQTAGIYIMTTNHPTPGADDIYQFVAGTSDANNIAGDSSYIAVDHPAQGQLFTTGSASGYTLSAFWLKLVDYSGTWSGLAKDQSCVVRIVDTSTASNTVVYTESLTVLNDYPDVVSAGAAGSGRWMKFKLTNPVSLDPNKMYGFDVGTADGACYYQVSGINTNDYSDNAYSSGVNGVADSTLTENVGNHTFMVELTAAGGPSVGPTILLAIPTGGPITISWPTSAGNGFNVLTNGNLLNSNGWGNANLTPYDDGNGHYVVTNGIGSESNLFYKLSN